MGPWLVSPRQAAHDSDVSPVQILEKAGNVQEFPFQEEHIHHLHSMQRVYAH